MAAATIEVIVDQTQTHLSRNQRLSIPVYTLCPRSRRRCNGRKCRF